MKTLTKSILTLMTFVLMSTTLMARDFTVQPLSVDGLGSYPKANVTLYLVHASKVFGSEFTVTKVFKVLTTTAIKGNSELSFGPFKIKQNWSSFKNPNAIVAVVHDQPRHALNKHGVIDGTPTVFAQPEYQNAGEVVPANEENQKLKARSAATLSELNTNAQIRI